MADGSMLALVVALSDRKHRADAAAALARELGAQALFAFVEDRQLEGVLVPAPGFPAVVAGGPAWRSLLESCRQPGTYRREVGFPTASSMTAALALVAHGLSLVFVGPVDEARLPNLAALTPLLAALLHAEHTEVVSAGHLRVAQESMLHATSLAASLDRALATLESQTFSLEEARKRAEEAARVKDEFLAMLGHELRNPLAPIGTALALLKLEGKKSRAHEVIERQVAHMTRLVDDLLDVSRIAQGKIELRKEPIELAQVVERAIEMTSPLIEQKQQTLLLEVPRGLRVEADPARLSQVLSNLFTNAAKYSEARSKILLRAERVADRICIRVKDDGVGIEPHMLDAVFDTFLQVRQSSDRAQGGLGLGLAIVRNLVALHGGSVSVRSEGKGQGSEFSIELPALDDEAVNPASGDRRDSDQDTSARGTHILIVDDNEDAAEMLCCYLGAKGHTVRAAADGKMALSLAQELRPDVAVLDIGLPGMDGYELAAHLRASPLTKGCRLIALTGYGQPSDQMRALEAGFDAHVVKPVELNRLEALVESLLGRPGT